MKISSKFYTGGLITILTVLGCQNAAFAQTGSCPWGFGSGMMGGAMGWFGGLFMLLFWGLVIAGIVFLLFRLIGAGKGGSSHPLARSESPADILKKRYARGEISKEEFESMRRDIE